ncbi:CDP-2,3-bis-(O-geranylgeranyl)-sn-glycerol synthase [Halorussus marinus]|uniref:CDP-2,3-bis-(O-geranylgeranyl)-sn-glycerol synthase n=1 Tax=Halorussus marinus TaxID=2505976 RepID=UPI00106EAF80|nr:CDP-2,3-bis-(O-geranylgeranyl)-sn-glycerol synthase [Halorussus marinus]
MSLFETIAVALWAMLPAYVPNNAAVLAGGGRPIDGGRTWGDRRLLGDGKTWRGTAVGVAAGAALAVALSALAPAASAAVGVDFPTFPAAVAVALPAGAMAGDIAASFLKRRTGRERGAAFPGLDQLDFVVFSLLFAFVAAPAWFGAVFTLPVLAVVVVATPLLHVGTNAVAYALGLKNEPW